MKLITADNSGRTDGSMYRLLEGVDSRLPIVLMSRTNDFCFNENLKKIDAYILCEVSELGWDWPITETHRWGINTCNFPQYQSEEYKKFDDWVAANPPKLTFHRELLAKDVSDILIPIDYPSWYNVPAPDTKESFNKRVVSFFHYFGRSHEGRLRTHADTWLGASRYGYSVCDNLYHYEKFISEEKGVLAVSLWQPYYARVDMGIMLAILAQSKIGIALFGAGRKTFRHTEVSSNSVPLIWEDGLSWAYSWEHNVNCIKSNQGDEIDCIMRSLQKDDLYDIYVAANETCRKYQVDNYIREYINKKTLLV